MNINEIGYFLLNKRKEKNLTQNELADLLNVSHQAVSRWERGENMPDVMKLVELSKLYGVSVDDILAQGETEEIPVKQTSSNKEKNYFIFTLVNIGFSIIGLMLFYILVLNGLQLGWGILFHYIIALSSTQFFIIPFILNPNRSRRVFNLFRVNIVVSSMLLLFPLISMFIWSYGYLSVITLLLDLLLGYIIYYVLVLVEQKTYNKKIYSKYLITNYIPMKRLVEIGIAALIVALFIMVIGFDGIMLFSITTYFSVIILYKIIRNFNIISLLQFIIYALTFFTLFWWSSIDEIISDEVYFEYLLGLDESLLTILTLSIFFIVVLLFVQWSKFRSSFSRFKLLNIQLLLLNFVLLIVYHISRPQLHIRRITETYNGSETITTSYIYDFSLNNSFPLMAFVVITFSLVIILDEFKRIRKTLKVT